MSFTFWSCLAETGVRRSLQTILAPANLHTDDAGEKWEADDWLLGVGWSVFCPTDSEEPQSEPRCAPKALGLRRKI